LFAHTSGELEGILYMTGVGVIDSSFFESETDMFATARGSWPV
jgi:hypothetical protein